EDASSLGRRDEDADCGVSFVSGGLSHRRCSPFVVRSLRENPGAGRPPRLCALAGDAAGTRLLLILFYHGNSGSGSGTISRARSTSGVWGTLRERHPPIRPPARTR